MKLNLCEFLREVKQRLHRRAESNLRPVVVIVPINHVFFLHLNFKNKVIDKQLSELVSAGFYPHRKLAALKYTPEPKLRNNPTEAVAALKNLCLTRMDEAVRSGRMITALSLDFDLRSRSDQTERTVQDG